jgi:hypothetical protein
VAGAAAIASPVLVGAGVAALRGAVASGALAADPAKALGGPAEHNEVISNPAAVALVRGVSMGLDDAAMAAAGVPYPVARLLGDGGLGITGLAFASTALMAAGSTVGLFTETPVRAIDAQSRQVSGAPTGFADRLDRVPYPDSDHPAQVVVEKYSSPGEPDRFEVYIGGTATFSPQATTEPWDMTSNLANAAGYGGGSYDSVVEAMRLAGVDDSSPVQLTGYSQGGGTAARLAASGDFNVVGLATFGAPTGQIHIPAAIPTVIVEHTDDIVPAFGGVQVNQQALIVERDVFAGREVPTDYAVPAHHIEYYEATARLMDAAASDQVTDAAARLAAFGAGATTVTSTAYTFERVEG